MHSSAHNLGNFFNYVSDTHSSEVVSISEATVCGHLTRTPRIDEGLRRGNKASFHSNQIDTIDR